MCAKLLANVLDSALFGGWGDIILVLNSKVLEQLATDYFTRKLSKKEELSADEGC